VVRVNNEPPHFYHEQQVQSIQMNGGTGADRLFVDSTVVPTTVNGNSTNTSVAVGNDGHISWNQAPVSVNGTAALTVDASAYSWNETVQMNASSLTGTFAPIYYGSILSLTVLTTQGNNTITVTGTPRTGAFYGGVTLMTGTGSNIVNAQGITAPVSVPPFTYLLGGPLTVNCRAAATINVGNNGSLQGIGSSLSLLNPPSWSHVNINDGADNANHPNVVLTADSLTGLAPATIYFQANSLAGLNITAGNGNNTYTVVNTAFSGTGNPTVLNTGNGSDTVIVQGTTASAPLTVNNGGLLNQMDYLGSGGTLTGLSGAVTLNNGTSYTTVYVNDGFDNTSHPLVALSASSLTGLPSAPIYFGPASLRALNITVGNGTDSYTITGAQAYQGTTLATGTGANTVAVTVTDPGGPVTLAGNPAGSNTLIGPDSPTTWNITAANAGSFRGTRNLVSFTNYRNLTGGSGGNTFAFSDAATLSGTLNGGSGGTNTLDSSPYTTPESFAISGANAGSGTPVGAFSNIQSLLGGRGGNNGFAFNDGGSLGASLNGGSGLGNTLDYSTGWTGNVTVDLPLGVASGIANPAMGAVGGIQNVVGASGGGSGLYDLLIGNGGNFLQGGTGRRNLLVAGASPSTLIGGDGEDLLIAGSTSYDGEPTLANWTAIAGYWTSADPFATRVANLLSGSGVPLLDPTTVTGNGGGGTLTGNGGLALIYADTLDQGGISGFDPASQLVTITP
jgi:hypothetical protein